MSPQGDRRRGDRPGQRGAAGQPLVDGAGGGAGETAHFPPAVEAGADAVLAATVFHFGKLRIGDVKAALGDAGVPVRRETDHPLR